MAIGAGLLAGAVVGVLGLGALILLVPVPAVPVGTPVPAGPTASAGASSSPGVSPGMTTGPSPSTSNPASASPPASSPEASSTASAFGVGQPAPILDVSQLGGGRIDLAALRGKPVWVNFMAAWCPSCRDELPLMAGFAARYESTGLVIVAIDVREDEATVNAFATQLGVALPIGLDVDGKAQDAWRAYALPVHFWIDADGIVRDGALGGIGPDVMAAGLKTILPGVDVTVP